MQASTAMHGPLRCNGLQTSHELVGRKNTTTPCKRTGTRLNGVGRTKPEAVITLCRRSTEQTSTASTEPIDLVGLRPNQRGTVTPETPLAVARYPALRRPTSASVLSFPFLDAVIQPHGRLVACSSAQSHTHTPPRNSRPPLRSAATLAACCPKRREIDGWQLDGEHGLYLALANAPQQRQAPTTVIRGSIALSCSRASAPAPGDNVTPAALATTGRCPSVAPTWLPPNAPEPCCARRRL